MASLPGLVDVKSSLQAGNPELQISYKRDQLSAYGLSLRNVAELVRHKVQGKVATDFRQDERQIDVRVRLREEDRLGLDELRRLVINSQCTHPDSAFPQWPIYGSTRGRARSAASTSSAPQ